MELYLKRYFWVVPVLVILGCGLLAAKGANQIIEAKFLLGENKKPSVPRHHVPRVTAAKGGPTKDAESIVQRNMFCSTCDPPPAVAATSSTSATPGDETRPPNTSLPLALVGTILAASQPEFSTATITNTQTFKLGSYGLHDQIPEAGEVLQIKPKFVDFRNKTSNRVERIELGGIPATPPPAAAPKTAEAAPAAATDPEAELVAAVDRGVKKIDETHYEIDRGLVDKILADPTVVARSARIVPSIKDGKANGFKMYAIRPNSVFAKIGMQNGDTLESVNGFDMTSPDKALEIYTKVKSASSLSISVLRRGQPVTMDYSIK